MAGWTEKGSDFSDESLRVRHLVQHPECKYKIGVAVETCAVRSADVEVCSVRHPAPFGPSLCPINHLGLNIEGEDAPSGPNQIGKCDTEVAEAAPDIDSGVAPGYESTQD